MRPMTSIFLLLFLGFSSFSFAQDVVELSVTEKSDSGAGVATRQEIFNKVTEDISLQYIREILGGQKLEKNRQLIENKILKNSGKYILYMKGGVLRPVGDQVEMDVTLKVSLKNLEAMLLNEGLLYRMDGPPRVLPMISFFDRVNSKSFSWWVGASKEDKRFLISELSRFHRELRDQLRPRGFYGLDPLFAGSALLAPEVFRSENPPTEDYLFLGEFFQSQIVIKGYFLISNGSTSGTHKIDIKLMALHSSNARVVGEVIRSYETESGSSFQQGVAQRLAEVMGKVAEDLSVQLHDAWKSGTFGASLIRLALMGDFSYPDVTELKKQILAQVKDVKTLRERLFAPGRVEFEMETSSNSRHLSELLQKVKIPRYGIQVSEVRSDGIDLKVRVN